MKQPNDSHSIDLAIVRRLEALGYSARPYKNGIQFETGDVLVSYVDKWIYGGIVVGGGMNIDSLEITFREPITEREIAGGSSTKDSMGRGKRPAQHVEAVLAAILE